jgi:hypothetical protein
VPIWTFGDRFFPSEDSSGCRRPRLSARQEMSFLTSSPPQTRPPGRPPRVLCSTTPTRWPVSIIRSGAVARLEPRRLTFDIWRQGGPRGDPAPSPWVDPSAHHAYARPRGNRRSVRATTLTYCRLHQTGDAQPTARLRRGWVRRPRLGEDPSGSSRAVNPVLGSPRRRPVSAP